MLLQLLVLPALASGSPPAGRICSWKHEDCTHTRCCRDPGHHCYKKNSLWAGCRRSCDKGGINYNDPPQHRTPWDCSPISDENPDCASPGEDCIHEGCCRRKDHKCWMKDPGEAFCRSHPPQGWLGHEIVAMAPTNDASHPGGGASQPGGGAERHNEDLSKNWRGGMQSTHYWDCNGHGCDAAYLNPWVKSKYVSPVQYAPMNPDHYGGSVYGEKIWMTGATSDAVSQILGPDTNDCGEDNGGGGGCGQCLLVKTNTANNMDWMVVIMKKNRCPPESNGCGQGQFHMDFAVPGFDHLGFSTANICGNPGTHLSKVQSGICGSVPPAQCNCAQIPTHTPSLKRLRDGCELFKAWGWHSGTPSMDWRPVPCPRKFVEHVKLDAAFSRTGPISLYDAGPGGNATLDDLGAPSGARGLPAPLERAARRWTWAAAVPLPLLAVVAFARGLLGVRRRRGARPVDSEALVVVE